MTAKLSPHKVANILGGYFSGLPQTEIAGKAGVDQSSVSHCVSNFKKMAAGPGILAAAKEYGVMNEVESLRSLSVELYQSKLTVEQAKQGHKIIGAFAKLGVGTEKHLKLIEVCQEVADPGFVAAALKLSQVQAANNVTYDAVVSAFQGMTNDIASMWKQILEKKAELKSMNDELAKVKQQRAQEKEGLGKYQSEAKAKMIEMDNILSAKKKQLNVNIKEVEEVAALKGELATKGLSLGTVVKLAKEFPHGTKLDSAKLNVALEKFGGLQQAIEQLEQHKLTLEKENAKLNQENKELTAANSSLAARKVELTGMVKTEETNLQSISGKIKALGRQYDLVCGFMAMVGRSPSVTESIDTLIGMFQHFGEPGWHLPKNLDEMRGLFVSAVMGDYLRSFRCDYCGGQFITNRKPTRGWVTSYSCPACHLYGVKGDDSFLNALISKEQVEKTYRTEELLKENEMLKPFSAFLSVPCEICHKPITEWDDSNVKMVADGIGFGHASCWNSAVGLVKEHSKVARDSNVNHHGGPSKDTERK